jgi:hypothetical protein
MKNRSLSLVLVFVLVFALMIQPCTTVYATDIEDNINTQQGGGNSDGDLFGGLRDQDIGDSEDIADILGNQQTMTSDQLNQASKWAAPLTNIIGYIMGIIIIIMIALVGLITALDLMYIAIPPVRNLLYKAGTDGTGAYTGGMPGGGYGMGGMGMGRRGMGMMGMGAMGAGGAAAGTARPTQWVSDEAVACAALLGGSQQAVSNGMGGAMGGMGMGMGAMGGMGMPGAQPAQDPPPVKSVMWVYLKKRAVFLVLLMVAVMVLTSSAIMGTGINLAQWVLRIINMINGTLA